MERILTQDNIEYMASLAFKNGIRIHKDSIVLFNSKSYSTSYFFSVLALEEFGKVIMLDDLFYHNNVDDNGTPEDEKEYLKQIYNHKTKQSYFMQSTTFFNDYKKVFKDIELGSMDVLKLNAIYVGLKKLDKEIVFSKNIINPSRHNKNKTRNLITLVNDQLIISCLGVKKEVYGYDIELINKQLNSKLQKELEWAWPLKSKNAQETINELLKIK